MFVVVIDKARKERYLYSTVRCVNGSGDGRWCCWLVWDDVQVETKSNSNNIYYCDGSSSWLVRGACAKEWYENGEEETPERGRHGRVNFCSKIFENCRADQQQTLGQFGDQERGQQHDQHRCASVVVAQGSVYGARAHPLPTETSLAQQVQQHADEQTLEDARDHFERNPIAPEGELEQEPVVLLRERRYAGHVEGGHFGRIGDGGVFRRPALFYSKREHGRDVEQQGDQKNGN
ncbi:hypothetical protein T07_8823 [Trichinella nelsoni]|uniref:Uncharacterized protein n=1 Tax=Trichinella nelsoni TaxID=6336 RepID=A0A0V0S6F8_9BILA|nr:hypothetical protein T07_8823 [Trichinella nelsoni]